MKNRQIAFYNETKRQNTKSVDYLAIGNGVFVLPYSFISGAVNLSEKGIETPNGTYLTDPASFLQTVFTGKDAINVCWDGSTYFTPNATNPNYLDYNFQVGDYFYGKPITGQVEGGAEISQVEGNDDFLAMKSSQSITIQFEYDEPITGDFYLFSVAEHHLVANDLYKRKLYRIPQLGENKWFYISNAQPVFADNSPKIIGTVVTFETVLDKLQSTGRAVEQYVQNGAPGEPRAVPKLEYEWDESGISGITLTLDENEKQLRQDRLIHYVQTELQGAGGYNGCMVYGRRLTETDGVITTEPWEMLLPHEFYQFNTNPLNKSSVPSSTYNFIPNYKLSMNITQDMLDAWKKVQDSLSTCQCAGKVYLGPVGDWNGELPTGTHKSNPDSLPYWDINWNPMGSISARTPIDMKGSPYTSSTASFLANETFRSLFIKNTFICMNSPQLPVEIDFSKPYHLSNIPIIGKLITPIIGDRTLFPNKTSIPQEGIGMFIDKSYLSKMVSLTPSTSRTTDVYSFLSALGGEMIPKGFGATSYNTSICWKLTDMFSDDKQTILLGQKRYQDGTYIQADHEPYVVDCDTLVQTKDANTGFVIDRIVLFSEFSGNVRFSFYNQDMETQYATTIISSTKFLDNSYNNYMTMVNFGTWPEEYISYDYDPEWPEQYGQITPLNVVIKTLDNYENYAVTPAGGTRVLQQLNWQHSYGRVEETSGSYKYFENTFTNNHSVTKTIPYEDLGLADVVDRDTLLSNYKEIQFNLNGTSLHAQLTDKRWAMNPVNSLSANNYVSFELEAGTFTYTGTKNLICINRTDGKVTKWDSGFLSFNYLSYNDLNYENHWFTLNFLQKIRIELSLTTEGLNIVATDISEVGHVNNTDFIVAFKNPVEPDEKGWCCGYYPGNDRHLLINAKIVLPFISFVKR